jgi:hypothetical protein
MQDKSVSSTPRIIPKQAGYDYIKRNEKFKNIKSESDNSSRQRMSCWWVLIPFLIFFAQYIDDMYDPSLMINLDETSVSQPKTVNNLVTIPSYSHDTYVPQAPQQKG